MKVFSLHTEYPIETLQIYFEGSRSYKGIVKKVPTDLIKAIAHKSGLFEVGSSKIKIKTQDQITEYFNLNKTQSENLNLNLINDRELIIVKTFKLLGRTANTSDIYNTFKKFQLPVNGGSQLLSSNPYVRAIQKGQYGKKGIYQFIIDPINITVESLKPHSYEDDDKTIIIELDKRTILTGKILVKSGLEDFQGNWLLKFSNIDFPIVVNGKQISKLDAIIKHFKLHEGQEIEIPFDHIEGRSIFCNIL